MKRCPSLSTRLLRLLAISVLLTLVGHILWSGVLFWMLFRGVDYGRLPPQEVFQRVFRQPVPSDVSDLRIAGHGVMMGHIVWMRFQATDQAMEALIKISEKTDARELMGATSVGYLSKSPEALSIGWDEVSRVRKPEYYKFDLVRKSIGWYGYYIVDRKRRIVFVWASLS